MIATHRSRLSNLPRAGAPGWVVAAVVLLAQTGTANAALTVYTTQATFAAATTAPAGDSFDDLALDLLPSSITRSPGSYTYTVGAPVGLYGVGSDADVFLSTNQVGDVISFGSFAGGVGGLGGLFFSTDAGGLIQPGQSFTLGASDSSGATLSYTLDNATQNSFVGFVSTAQLVALTVTPLGSGSFATVNDLLVAQSAAAPVPELPGWLLLAAGMVGFRCQQRRAACRT